MQGVPEGEGISMNGVGLFTIGLYILIISALDITPPVLAGVVCTVLGLIFMIVSSRRGDHD